MSARHQIRIALIGATGYGGREVMRLILKHPKAVLTFAAADDSFLGKSVSGIFPEFKNRIELKCEKIDPAEIGKRADVVMIATPDGVGAKLAGTLIDQGLKVLDFSADFRFDDLNIHRKFYNFEHPDPELNKEAVYGMPEFYSDEIKKARIVACPGCYPTSAIIGCVPLIKSGMSADNNIIINSLSGASGAGRKANVNFIFPEVNEDIKPYGAGIHRHYPEMEQEITKLGGSKVNVLFVPHLAPLTQGILSDIYIELKSAITNAELHKIYSDFYKNHYFIRILEQGVYPRLTSVAGTNFCDIGLYSDEKTKKAVIFSAIDNLGKGLSSQAVQCMNIMFGLDEREGLL
ncbi:MAG: N-acetyl-gamma-glutamyl-phosphate reductase [bacterium]